MRYFIYKKKYKNQVKYRFHIQKNSKDKRAVVVKYVKMLVF